MDKDNAPGVWTLANLFSLLRILLILPFILALAGRRGGLALALFVVAGLTDFLDGLAARALKQQSRLGVLLDPIADKLLMTAAFICLSLESMGGPNIIPSWLVVLAIGRDAAIALGAYIIVKTRGTRPFLPTLWGKASTVIQIGCVVLVLGLNWRGATPSWLIWVYVLTLTVTLLSGAHYFALRFMPWMKNK